MVVAVVYRHSSSVASSAIWAAAGALGAAGAVAGLGEEVEVLVVALVGVAALAAAAPVAVGKADRAMKFVFRIRLLGSHVTFVVFVPEG